MNGRWIRKQSEYVFVPQDHSGTGVMAAFAPPKRVTEALALPHEHAEPEHDLHVTLAYLGKTDEYSRGQLRDLPEVMDSWAEGHKPRRLEVTGAGHFISDGDDGQPLIALVNSPGLHRMQAHLVDHLKHYGYNPRENFGYIPHITLGYSRHSVRFLPKVQPQQWLARDVWSAIGSERRPHALGGRVAS
jgi:2'-5' RNA ligase